MKGIKVFKIFLIVTIVLVVQACSNKTVEGFAFREALKYQLVEKCGEEEPCQEAVKTQIKPCLESADWYQFYQNQEDDTERTRFLIAFYGCIVDPTGQPYFEPAIE